MPATPRDRMMCKFVLRASMGEKDPASVILLDRFYRWDVARGCIVARHPTTCAIAQTWDVLTVWTDQVIDALDCVLANEPRWEPHSVLRLEVAPSAPLPTGVPPIHIDDPNAPFVGMPGSIGLWHQPNGLTASALACFFSDSIVVSASGLLWFGEKVITARELMPQYWRALLSDKSDQSRPRAEFALPIRTIEETCISAIGWGQRVYGHVITEMLPRLVLALEAAKHLDPAPLVLLRSDAPPWVIDICTYIIGDQGRIVFFDGARERVLLRRGIFPSYSCLHPTMMGLIDSYFPSWQNKPGKGLRFLLRREVTTPRFCVNEDRLAAIAETEFGASVFIPEALPWIEQVQLFRTTRTIVGLYGSGLHTALFSGASPLLGIVGAVNNIQSVIARLRRHPLAYQLAGFTPVGRYEVPEDGFRALMRAISSYYLRLSPGELH